MDSKNDAARDLHDSITPNREALLAQLAELISEEDLPIEIREALMTGFGEELNAEIVSKRTNRS